MRIIILIWMKLWMLLLINMGIANYNSDLLSNLFRSASTFMVHKDEMQLFRNMENYQNARYQN